MGRRMIRNKKYSSDPSATKSIEAKKKRKSFIPIQDLFTKIRTDKAMRGNPPTKRRFACDSDFAME